jgi:glycosyltransferase involved in cell wall biosynthesis
MIKASACVIAYNHEKYIKDCLEGALKQNVDFEYEIIISEDCSTDQTREICQEYQKKYPDKIKLHLNETNLSLMGNWLKALSLCRGEYVAICEGDDYWTDPDKLKKQVDFLDSHKDFSLSSHNAKVIKNGAIIRKYCGDKHPEIMDLKYILGHGSGGPTCSLVIRNSAIQNLPGWFSEMRACDWTIQTMAARSGKMKYFKDIMGVYRKHDKGAGFAAKTNAKKIGNSDFALPSKYTLEMIDNLNQHFNYQYDWELKRLSAYWHNLYINEYLKISDYKMARVYAKKILKVILPLSYWRDSWLTKKLFFRLWLVFLPIALQKNINIIYKYFFTEKQ